MADNKRKSEETNARSLSDKKFHRASRRFDDLQDYEHPADTRYKGAVAVKDNPAARSHKEIDAAVPTIDDLFEENHYEIKNAKNAAPLKPKARKPKRKKRRKPRRARPST